MQIVAGELEILEGGKISSDVLSFAKGDAGTVQVVVGELEILEGGKISSDVLSFAEGDAGTVQVVVGDTDRLLIRGGAISSSAEHFSTGKAGAVKVRRRRAEDPRRWRDQQRHQSQRQWRHGDS